MSESMDEQDLFRFFDLPRELRNMVYDELKQSKQAVALTGMLTAVIEDGPMPNLLTISQRFKSEYEDRLSGTGTLSVQSTLGYIFNYNPPQFTERLRRIPALNLSVPILCRNCDHTDASVCSMELYIAACEGLLSHLVTQLHRIQSLTLRIHLYRSLGYDTPSLLSSNYALSSILKKLSQTVTVMASIKIFVSIGPEDDIVDNYEGPVCVEWDVENGWQEHEIEADEDYVRYAGNVADRVEEDMVTHDGWSANGGREYDESE